MKSLTRAEFDVALKNNDTVALEPYRAKRAIFLASGFGSRLRPITINTPKPLVRVNGKRMIETSINACLEAGIEDIYIVCGYLGEQFEELRTKYPMVKLLHNLDYDKANNIGSALVAKDLIRDAYVLEADLVISNPEIIRKYNYCSNVLGIWKEKTEDWCLITNDDGYVVDEKIGGENCYQIVGVYYFNASDGEKLSGHLEAAFASPGGKDRFWDTVPNQVYKGEYNIGVIPCQESDVVEIDTFDELRKIDSSYNI